MTESTQLPKWHGNQIFEAITGAGLDPRDFDLNGNAEIRIKHKWSKSSFIIGGDASHYVVSYVVGDGLAAQLDKHSWETLMQSVKGWLALVKVDLDTPDLWSKLRSESELLGSASDDGAANTPFTIDEQEEIARLLQAFAEHARQTNLLTLEQIQDLEARLDYLANASRHLGRIDWRNVFMGVIVAYLLGVAFPEEVTRHMLLTVLRGVVPFFNALPGRPLGM
jgi:hypothetical protein